MSLSIIVPVYHEGAEVYDSIASLLSRSDFLPEDEVIVSDGSLGGSGEGFWNPQIKIAHSRKGRGAQMNAGAKVSKGDILFFLHADSNLPASALDKIRAALLDPALSGGAFSLKIGSRHFFLKLVSAATNLRCRLNRIPYGDQGIFIRREVFFGVSMFPDIPLMEDVELMRRLKKKGFRIAILKERIITSSRRWEKRGYFVTTFRNRLISLLFILGIRPEVLARFYRE